MKKCLCALGLTLVTLQVHASWFEFSPSKDRAKATEEQPTQQSCEKMGGINPGSGKRSTLQDISRVQIGGNYTRAHIKIKGQPSFNGNLGGAQAMYELRPVTSFYGALGVTWKQGTTDGGSAHRKLLYVDVQERVGYSYATSCMNWTASVFTGFGYRHLGHNLHQHGTHIKFEYNEFYIPVGIVTNYNFNSWFAGGLNFIWMPQIYPTVKIVPLNGARWITKCSLNNFLAELPVTFTFGGTRRLSLIVKPFYEYWQDGKTTAKTKSPTKLVLGLPGIIYNFWGAELNLGYTF